MARPWTLPVALTAFAISVSAYTTWDTTCRLPPTPVNFVSAPDTRGTMDIIWSCLAVLITCTYSVQHLSVPPLRSEEPKPWIVEWRTRWKATTWTRWRFLASLHPRHLVGDERWHKLQWMTLTVLAPEYVLGKALAESSAAHHSVLEMKQFAAKQSPQTSWSLTHGFLANMSGLAMRFDVAAVPTDLTPSKADNESRALHKLTRDGDPSYEEQDAHAAERRELDMCKRICGVPCRNRPEMAASLPSSALGPTSSQTWPLNHDEGNDFHPLGLKEHHDLEKGSSNLADAHHKLPSDSHERTLRSSKTDASESGHTQQVLGPHRTWTGIWALSSAQWFYACSSGIITDPPDVGLEDIKDRSKEDTLVKVVAAGQILWLVIQICARAVQDLAITLLEITIVAFAACAIITYLLLLHKPKDVSRPFVVNKNGVLTRAQIIGLAARAQPSSLFVQHFWLHGVSVKGMADNNFPPSPSTRFNIPFAHGPINLRIDAVLGGIGFGGILFGSLHFAAWNFVFPTEAEKILWRVSCGVLTAIPLVNTTLYWGAQQVFKRKGQDDATLLRILKFVGYAQIPLYLVARTFVLVEVFRSLAYPAPTTFQNVDWAAMLPHAS